MYLTVTHSMDSVSLMFYESSAHTSSPSTKHKSSLPLLLTTVALQLLLPVNPAADVHERKGKDSDNVAALGDRTLSHV